MALKVNYYCLKSRTKSGLKWLSSKWRKIISLVPQGSVLGPLLFLIYTNDLPDGINSLCKIFADNTSLFSKVYDIHKSPSQFNNDLEKISYWAYEWKM